MFLVDGSWSVGRDNFKYIRSLISAVSGAFDIGADKARVGVVQYSSDTRAEFNLNQHMTSAAHLRNEQNSVEELPEGGATFKCVKCTERFDSEQELFVHIKEKHEELLKEVNKYVQEDTEQINREREENQGLGSP